LGRRAGLVVNGEDYDTPDGTCIRDFIHVQDLALAHVTALAALDGGVPFRALNLGTATGHSVREVLRSVERVGGRRVPTTAGPGPHGVPPPAGGGRRRLAAGAAVRAEDRRAGRDRGARLALPRRSSPGLRGVPPRRPTPLQDPLLSVVMPVYNEISTVEEMI